MNEKDIDKLGYKKNILPLGAMFGHNVFID